MSKAHPVHATLVELLGELPEHGDVLLPHPEPVEESLALSDFCPGLILLGHLAAFVSLVGP